MTEPITAPIADPSFPAAEQIPFCQLDGRFIPLYEAQDPALSNEWGKARDEFVKRYGVLQGSSDYRDRLQGLCRRESVAVKGHNDYAISMRHIDAKESAEELIVESAALEAQLAELNAVKLPHMAQALARSPAHGAVLQSALELAFSFVGGIVISSAIFGVGVPLATDAAIYGVVSHAELKALVQKFLAYSMALERQEQGKRCGPGMDGLRRDLVPTLVDSVRSLARQLLETTVALMRAAPATAERHMDFLMLGVVSGLMILNEEDAIAPAALSPMDPRAELQALADMSRQQVIETDAHLDRYRAQRNELRRELTAKNAEYRTLGIELIARTQGIPKEVLASMDSAAVGVAANAALARLQSGINGRVIAMGVGGALGATVAFGPGAPALHSVYTTLLRDRWWDRVLGKGQSAAARRDWYTLQAGAARVAAALCPDQEGIIVDVNHNGFQIDAPAEAVQAATNALLQWTDYFEEGIAAASNAPYTSFKTFFTRRGIADGSEKMVLLVLLAQMRTELNEGDLDAARATRDELERLFREYCDNWSDDDARVLGGKVKVVLEIGLLLALPAPIKVVRRASMPAQVVKVIARLAA